MLTSRTSTSPALEGARSTDTPEILERFTSGLDLVDRLAARIGASLGSSVERDELLATGREGLLDAARRYDPSRGVPFAGYASYRIRGAMLDGIRKAAAMPRRAHERLAALDAVASIGEGELEHAYARAATRPDFGDAEDFLTEHLEAIATAAALASISDTPAAERAHSPEHEPDNPEQAFARAELAARVRAAIGELPAEASAVVRRHLMEGERLEDIARDFAMSKSWASRLLTRTTARLAKRLRGLV